MPVTLQPTSLKYKNSNGVFQNATAIQGESPVVAVADITGGHRITITDVEGAHSFDVMDGEDYVLTQQDKVDIAAMVDAPVQDVQVNGTSILSQGVANVPIAGDNTYGAVRTNGEYGVYVNSSGFLQTSSVSSALIKSGVHTTRTIKPANQHESTFYGLSKAAGVDLANETVTLGTYPDTAKAAIKTMLGVTDPTVTDVQVNGVSVLSDGVANVPLASRTQVGAVKLATDGGITALNDGSVLIDYANADNIKSANSYYKPIVPAMQRRSVFYGLAASAGDTTQSSSSNTVGNYTDAAKSAISQMLNGSVAVTGTTPIITALSGIRYVCGEVATLSFTPSATGICDVVFTSGSTATVLTVPNTVKWPAWFNPASLEANVTYEINILDGVYGAVGIWS